MLFSRGSRPGTRYSSASTCGHSSGSFRRACHALGHARRSTSDWADCKRAAMRPRTLVVGERGFLLKCWRKEETRRNPGCVMRCPEKSVSARIKVRGLANFSKRSYQGEVHFKTRASVRHQRKDNAITSGQYRRFCWRIRSNFAVSATAITAITPACTGSLTTRSATLGTLPAMFNEMT